MLLLWFESLSVIGGLNVYAGSLPLVTTQPLLGLRGGDIVEICQHALSRELNYVQIGLLAGWVAYNDILCERCGAVGHARRQNICTKFRHLLRLNAPPVDDNFFQANIEFIDVLRASDILALLRPALAEALMAWR